MNRWLWIGAGAAAVAAAAMAAADRAGRRLPVEHVSEGGLELDQPPGAVWEVLTDIDLYPAWRPGLTHVERLPAAAGGRPRWREYDRHGHTTYEVVASEAPNRLVTGIADPDLPYGGTWTYVLTPAGEGCTLTVTERGEVRKPLYRAVSHYVTGEGTAIHRYLGALAHRMA
ncbi:SRPBCC domain-containing protein [Kitasatospora aureofaciens]|uniref:SRPBCC family protein n=1 Tax=Kitasatospora aureofaciens TaxID=1894 RepID=UPI001C4491C4|nr:SRPBCC family protein [Kitasatospora aureofaciens]MBV6700936.1 SRPBCC family protein [Kitasatospora aureofaciens]